MDKQMMMNLKQAISSVLETMFFLPVQIVEDGGFLDNWSQQNIELWHVKIRFRGPAEGFFFLLVPINLAQEITANFLGLGEAEVERSQEADTVKEALNMIGGYVLSQDAQADQFQLGIPEITAEKNPDLACKQAAPENIVVIETDGNHLAVGLHLD